MQRLRLYDLEAEFSAMQTTLTGDGESEGRSLPPAGRFLKRTDFAIRARRFPEDRELR